MLAKLLTGPAWRLVAEDACCADFAVWQHAQVLRPHALHVCSPEMHAVRCETTKKECAIPHTVKGHQE